MNTNGEIVHSNVLVYTIVVYLIDELLHTETENLILPLLKHVHSDYFMSPKRIQICIGKAINALGKNGEVFPIKIGLKRIERIRTI